MPDIKNNGHAYRIRTGVLEDAEAVLDVQNSVISEGEYFIAVSEEFNKTPEQQRDWIRRLLENERETIIVAEMNDEVVGWIALQSENRKRMSHKGSFGVMIRKISEGWALEKSLLKRYWIGQKPIL